MSKPLSVLIVENFVINEGPKWDKFKKDVKKVEHGAVALGTKEEKNKQTNKSLKERLELVQSGMSLNEDAILAMTAIATAGIASLLSGVLAKWAVKMETKNMITNFANSLKNDKDSKVTVSIMNNIVKQKGSKEEKQEFKMLYNELLSLISRGKMDIAVATDKDEVLDKRVYNVTGFLQKDEEQKKRNKLSEEKSEKAYSLIKRMYEIYKGVSNRIIQPNKQTNKSLKERLELVKSGMSLNEEDAEEVVLEKERYSDGHTPETIASLHNVPVQDILDQIEKGIKVEREHTSDKDEARLIAMDHLVELPDYYTRLDKMEEEGKMENSINESEKK